MKPIFFELPKTGKYVHYTFFSSAKCSPGQYRSKKQKGVQTVFCCARGSKMIGRCCRVGQACTSKPKVQSVRVPIAVFRRKHPALWQKLQAKKPGRYGEKKIYT